MRGYIYTLDVTIAILIIVIGILSLFSFYSFDPDTQATQRFTTETLSTLDTIELAALCATIEPGECDCGGYHTIADMCSNGDLRMDQSVLSGFGELYYRGEREAIDRIVEEVLVEQDLIPPQYGFKIYLEDETGTEHQLYPLIEVSP